MHNIILSFIIILALFAKPLFIYVYNKAAYQSVNESDLYSFIWTYGIYVAFLVILYWVSRLISNKILNIYVIFPILLFLCGMAILGRFEYYGTNVIDGQITVKGYRFIIMETIHVSTLVMLVHFLFHLITKRK